MRSYASDLNSPRNYVSSAGATAKVEVQEYNDNWPISFTDEKNSLLKIIGEFVIDVQHIGSTSVPQLPAKPTIDICIGVESLKIADDNIIRALVEMGYEYLPFLENMISNRRYLQKIDDNGTHLFHIHIVVHNSELWINYILFREYMIAHPIEKARYADLKLSLKDQFSHDREKYTKGKAEYITEILNKAQIWRKQNI